ncbi:MAG: hypothetical protein JKY70_17600 [Mucilaginibacter sp.]|nr:hypothetical protein [Mucilaginibacter sp.]
MTIDNIIKVTELLLTFVGFCIGYVVFRLQANTFRLQQKTTQLQLVALKEQQQITNLEQQRFLLQIMPRFAKKSDWPEDVFDNPKPSPFTFGITLNANTCSNCLIQNIGGNLQDLIHEFRVASIQLGETIMFGQGTGHPEKYKEILYVTITFEDSLKNKYVQIMHGQLKAMQLTHPIPYSGNMTKDKAFEILAGMMNGKQGFNIHRK